MRLSVLTIALLYFLGGIAPAMAAAALHSKEQAAQSIEVTADKSLEWHQEKNTYIARGNAKVVRGDLTITADNMTAHQREKDKKDKAANPSEAGDIDKMTAEGNVVILKGKARITGDRAVEDMDRHVVTVTGKNLRYQTEAHTVTSTRSLEYWDQKKMAVARGDATAVKGDRHVSADVLTAEFRSGPDGEDRLSRLSAEGNVAVITKNDVTRGDKAVYDEDRDVATVTGHVRITRADGTELSGDVGETDFAANQSRLLNAGSGRVRVLLPPKASKPKSMATTHGEKP